MPKEQLHYIFEKTNKKIKMLSFTRNPKYNYRITVKAYYCHSWGDCGHWSASS
jgi:hypothetical protein